MENAWYDHFRPRPWPISHNNKFPFFSLILCLSDWTSFPHFFPWTGSPWSGPRLPDSTSWGSTQCFPCFAGGSDGDRDDKHSGVNGEHLRLDAAGNDNDESRIKLIDWLMTKNTKWWKLQWWIRYLSNLEIYFIYWLTDWLSDFELGGVLGVPSQSLFQTTWMPRSSSLLLPIL